MSYRVAALTASGDTTVSSSIPAIPSWAEIQICFVGPLVRDAFRATICSYSRRRYVHASLPYTPITCHARCSATSGAGTGQVPIDVVAGGAVVADLGRVGRFLEPGAQQDVVVHPGTITVYTGKVTRSTVDFAQRDARRRARARAAGGAACRDTSDEETDRDSSCTYC